MLERENIGAQPPAGGKPAATGQHPDYELERAHLQKTIAAFDSQIKAFTVSMPGKKDWTLHQLWRMWTRSRKRLEEVRDQPYFGRIDFASTGGTGGAAKGAVPAKATGAPPDAYYIGRIGAPGVTDWRAPVASLFYESTGGAAKYAAPGGPVYGFLSLRRQYRIESGTLIALYDSLLRDQITKSVLGTGEQGWTDEYLIAQLGRGAGERLKDIIATIQSEQNQVIRAPLDKLVVVQGVAGSGKTTVALHRVAYLLYTYPVQVKPERVLVLAPNRLFLQYIEELLPQTLGGVGVVQEALLDWLLKAAGVKTAQAGGTSSLSRFLRSNDAAPVLDAWIQRFVDTGLLPAADCFFGSSYSVTQDEMRRWFYEDYALWPVMTRIERIRKRLAAERERYLEKARSLIYQEEPPQPARRRSLLGIDAEPGASDRRGRGAGRISMVERASRLRTAEKESKELLDAYLRLFPKSGVHLRAWQQFLSDPAGALVHAGQAAERQLHERAAAAGKHRVQAEDLPALAYMHDALFGIPDSDRKDHIVVDEAQELTPLVCTLLRSRCRTPSMTLAGDLAQAITSPEPALTWREVIGDVAEQDSLEEFAFEKSYRSTCEIVELARGVLERAGECALLPEPVLRHGPAPQVRGFEDSEEMVDAIVQAFDDMAGRIRSFAVIVPTADDAVMTHQALQDRGVSLCLLASPDSSRSGAGVVAPVEVVRGLEFDGVIVAGASEEHFPASSSGARRLYVALTRALHEICVFWVGKPSILLPSTLPPSALPPSALPPSTLVPPES